MLPQLRASIETPPRRAGDEPVSVGDALLEMPLFLKAGGHVPVALESTYQSVWEAVPRRWRSVIEG